jgi:hypothetical protein
VELTERWNFFDQLMPLYNTKPRFYRESFPSTSLMDKAHKFLASISSGDSVWKMITSVTSQAMKTHQRRGVLTRSIEPYDSDQECVHSSKAFSFFISSHFFFWKSIASH